MRNDHRWSEPNSNQFGKVEEQSATYKEKRRIRGGKDRDEVQGLEVREGRREDNKEEGKKKKRKSWPCPVLVWHEEVLTIQETSCSLSGEQREESGLMGPAAPGLTLFLCLTGWLNIQALPNPVLEGESLTLRCQGWKNMELSQVNFYKDGARLHSSNGKNILSIQTATLKSSGQYSCSGSVTYLPHIGRETSGTTTVQVQAPVCRPLLTLPHRIISPAVGDLVELFCEVQRGSPPVLYSFYFDGKLLGNLSAPHGGAASLLVPVKSEQDIGNSSCEAENSVSRERSEPRKISLKGSQVLSTPTHCNWPVVYLPAGLLGVMVIAAALLGYFKPWKKAGPLPSQDLPPAPGGEQCPIYGNVHHQKDEDVTCPVVHTTLKRSKCRPVQLTSEPKDISIIYAEVRKPGHREISPEELSLNHAHPGPLGDYDEVLY
ncbi:Fc receptor-like protein 6 isoform X2 [Oryctolagus cuniculus]|uniref:Fc receptor-like protein 6 isoform X2 n=1 Tax=Oryctolagus cuniculus TaxID=9986 RepID=UPI00387A725F